MEGALEETLTPAHKVQVHDSMCTEIVASRKAALQPANTNLLCVLNGPFSLSGQQQVCSSSPEEQY